MLDPESSEISVKVCLRRRSTVSFIPSLWPVPEVQRLSALPSVRFVSGAFSTSVVRLDRNRQPDRGRSVTDPDLSTAAPYGCE